MYEYAIWLWIAHAIGDFAFQNDFVATNKRNDIYILLAHASIWAGTISIVLLYFGIFTQWKVIFLILGHALIDYAKCKGRIDMKIDQALHLLQLVIVGLPG